MRVAVVQLEYGDDESSGARVERVCARVAGLAGHDLVVLPELWMPTGFGYRRWAELAEPLDGPWARAVADAARAASVALHAGSFVER
ncbi:MAG: nitrilase-related carbon-nitrogen hydrolase, partial [Phycicoccus sp.]